MIETFGLKMDGLAETAQSTGEYPWRGLDYDEIFYNIRTGKVWSIHRVSAIRTATTEYDNNPSVVKIANNTSKLSEQQLATKIYRGLLKAGRITRA